MTKLLLLSDSHGDQAAVERVLAKETDAEVLIFLGDGDEDMEKAVQALKLDLPTHIVRGNCDYGSHAPTEEVLYSEGFFLLLTHGHLHHVGHSGHVDDLRRYALRKQCDIALYGHSHCPDADEKPGWPSLYNPGSIGRPRGDNGPTYGVLLLERGEKPRFQLCPVPPKA